ncbi:hypothetical protein B6D60_03985 [candidate division KSB1 bacterium 4484_87]|nr:MAG: hypothetical protein B6D60_03985 [candidate division KSB1 bacterium 4484_87]
MSSKRAIRGGAVVIILLVLFSGVYANGLTGGRGLTYVKSAWNLKPGYLTMLARSQVWGKVVSKNLPTTTSSIGVWDIQGALSFSYGFSNHIEMSIAPIVYQDTQRGEKKYMAPGDLYLGLKFGSYNIKGTSLTWGVSVNSRFPTGKEANIQFEPYSAGTVEWGFLGMLSYSRDPLYPEESLNVDFNLGYINHNDVGEKLSGNENDPYGVPSMTQEFLFGAGVKIPANGFDFSLELFGNSFIQKPPKETAYSVENYLFLTPTISYQAYRWLNLRVGADFRLTSDKDETTYQFISHSDDLPNYPGWRLNFGMNLLLLPVSAYKTSDKDVLIKKAESRRELFEQIIREQKETESAEEELQRIKEERRKAERELERLRKILEGEKKKPTKQPPPQP